MNQLTLDQLAEQSPVATRELIRLRAELAEANAQLKATLYDKPVPADKPAVAVPDGFREIVEAVAHIGVDSGYGDFALSQEHIEKARALLAVAPSHSQQSAIPAHACELNTAYDGSCLICETDSEEAR